MEHNKQVEILNEILRQLDKGETTDAGHLYQLSTNVYTCPDIASQENEAFFQNHPQLIGLSKDLPEPGSYLTTDDFGTPILATRDKNGRFRAMLNACRHRSVKVASEARGKKSVFMCPFHNWSYANTGELINIPDQDHFGAIDKSCRGLIELPAQERDGMLWVHPKADGKIELDALLGDELSTEIGSFDLGNYHYVTGKTIDKNLNWKLANDTFGETYHFGKLHKDTINSIYQGNNLHFEEFGRNHRFVTANRGIDEMRQLPEADWNITHGAFVLYYLFPNIQIVVENQIITMIRIYPDTRNPGRSISKVSLYWTPEVIDMLSAQEADGASFEELWDKERGQLALPSVEASLEAFSSAVENEDYLMGEMQQKAAEDGQLKEVIFGRNEPPLQHFHKNFAEALGLPKLKEVS
jgi:phenylpropionate dioxygenase-like ring-hydroxylating dioxygenase large terminal subunit